FKAHASRESWNEEHAAVMHHLQRFIVEECPVFDRIDARTNRPLGRFGSMRMCGSFSAKRMRLSDERVEFSLTQLGHIDVVCRRQNPAAGTSLDNVGAVYDVEPNCITRIVFGIDDAILRTALMIEH